jgi:rhamnopyranosyl-N-acetylglucosaminyl-diphospho-decaprenol beta-1,3/1,4-galactofuranosyltransferase
VALSVAAVVVSFNRLDYLKKCLAALESQTRPLDEIVVVENGSTDGSSDYVRKYHPNVTLFETGANLGGAGGFAWGVEIALAHGHDSAWLMDDDAEPHPGALLPLVGAMESKPRPGFAAALVEDDQGNVNPHNLPAISTDPQAQLKAQRIGGVALLHASFVGVLIDLGIAAKMPLPYADFFIWFDDVEYTKRLEKASFGVYVVSSRMIHPNKASAPDMGSRLFYYLRNQLWITRLSPGPRTLTQRPIFRFLELCQLSLGQFKHAKRKGLWFRSVALGLSHGMLNTPRRVMPGDLLATLSQESRKGINV